MEIRGKDAKEVWKKALKHILENGHDFIDRLDRLCRESLNLVLVIENSKEITKPIEILNSFDRWIYPPLEELKSFILNKKEIPGYYYNYGERAFNFKGLNQLDEYVIPLLKRDITNKRGIMIFYDPNRDSLVTKKDTPCIVLIDFKVRNNQLHTTALIRSNDMFFGWPCNIYQTSVLQEYVRKQFGCKLGNLTTISISAHIFEEQFEWIERIIK